MGNVGHDLLPVELHQQLVARAGVELLLDVLDVYKRQVLLSVGKEHVYIWEKDDTRFHENEAARILGEMSRNDYMDASEPSEGKIELTAQRCV